MKIKHFFENENTGDTMNFIESKRNWDVKNQSYRNPKAENCQAQLTDCGIYWRGRYLIVEHDSIIHYWEHNGEYCYFKKAVDLMQLDKPAKWKTIDKLIAFRQAIRQTEVNLCGFVDRLLIEKPLTYALHKEFMALAREQDFEHHGQHTF